MHAAAPGWCRGASRAAAVSGELSQTLPVFTPQVLVSTLGTADIFSGLKKKKKLLVSSLKKLEEWRQLRALLPAAEGWWWLADGGVLLSRCSPPVSSCGPPVPEGGGETGRGWPQWRWKWPRGAGSCSRAGRVVPRAEAQGSSVALPGRAGSCTRGGGQDSAQDRASRPLSCSPAPFSPVSPLCALVAPGAAPSPPSLSRGHLRSVPGR